MGRQKRERDRLEGLAFLVLIILALICWPATLAMCGFGLLVLIFKFWFL